MKCNNCKQIKEEKYYKYQGDNYCYTCLLYYFRNELIEDAFESFLYEECESL